MTGLRPHVLLLLLLSLIAGAANAAAPQDFESGLELNPDPARPVAELPLPELVYRGVTRADLYDVGVFNAQGTPVPFAFCPPVIQTSAAPELRQQALTVFTLKGAGPPRAGGSRVDVTGADGLSVTVQPGAAAEAGQDSQTLSYVVDTAPIAYPLVGLYLGWQNNASELHLHLDQSDDLDHWDTLIPETTLVRADANGQTLARDRIPLPSGHRRYLRLTRADPGPPPIIQPVQAEFAVPENVTHPPQRTSPVAMPQAPGETGFLFDARHLAPMQGALITLPAVNMNLQVALQSRADRDNPWRTVWSGPVFSIASGGVVTRRSPYPEFSPDSDRWWRIEVLQGADTLGQGRLGLLLDYYPAVLRFLTQGQGPFVLAYGSRRVTQASATACDQLLQGLPRDELQALVSRDFRWGEVRSLGGAPVLQAAPPPPKPTPRGQVVLWLVLLLGAGAVAWMALSLLGRLRERQS